MDAAAIFIKQNNSSCQHSSMSTANSKFIHTPQAKNNTVHILLSVHDPGTSQGWKSQNSNNRTLLGEDPLMNSLVLGNDVFPIHAYTSACIVILLHPCFITSDNQSSKASPSHYHSLKLCAFPHTPI